MDWLDYLIEGLIAALVILAIGWTIADISIRAVRTVACFAGLALITLVLYAAFNTAVSSFASEANAILSSIDADSLGNAAVLIAAVIPHNLGECIGAVLAVMVARLIYDWNQDLIKTICG